MLRLDCHAPPWLETIWRTSWELPFLPSLPSFPPHFQKVPLSPASPPPPRSGFLSFPPFPDAISSLLNHFSIRGSDPGGLWPGTSSTVLRCRASHDEWSQGRQNIWQLAVTLTSSCLEVQSCHQPQTGSGSQRAVHSTQHRGWTHSHNLWLFNL